MLRELALLAVWLAPALAQKTGTFEIAGETKISAMMMFVGNEEKVYILDKAEGNAARAPIGDRPAWGAVWDVNTRKVDLMDVRTNVFCASGMHLPNGSWATFGGNGAVGPGGGLGDIGNVGYQAGDDSTYKNLAGQKAIRLLDVCKTGEDFTSDKCKWFDDPTVLAMQKQRWYSSAEPLGDGTIVMIGGFVNGGYINRNWPNVDPAREGGAAEPTYEFFPPNGQEAQVMQFMIKTSGLNSYAHAYMMPSGRMFVQANISTTLWDVQNNRETALPDMPKGIARVYPASGAVGMLPLTPENNYNPTILFCGGTDMPDEAWGNYLHPFINTWLYPASKDCQRITPEPTDGSAPVYEQDDDMLEGRTMGEFVILADGKFLLLNGAANGTAGYADATRETPIGQMPFGMSLASAPTLKPVIYDPTAAKGKRWSDAGLSASTIPRLYHSSALLLPDGSVLVAGSNPNVDVNFTVPFPTEYRAEIFYPSYLSASVRPEPTGIPSTLSYGGASFDITIPASSYSGSSNTAADSIKINVIRSGWVTHAMSMGRRFLTLRHTYTVQNDGSIVVHVSQMPPNANIFQPGPAFVHVLVNGIPSVGKYVIVGSGKIERQPLAQDATLPTNVRLDSARGSADGSQTGTGNGSNNNNTTPGSSADNGSSKAMSTGAIIGAAAGAAAVLALLGAVLFFLCRRRRPAATRDQAGPAMSTRHGDGATYEGLGTNYGPPSPGLYTTSALGGAAGGVGNRAQFITNADSNMGPPQANPGADWRNGSSVSLLSPSNVERTSSPGYYDPYAERHSGRH